MGNVLKAIEPYLKQQHAGNTQALADAARYLKSGDPADLERLKSTPRHGIYWISLIGRAIGAPDRMTEEDWRGLHTLAASGHFEAINEWLSRGLAKEKPEADLYGPIRAELAVVGWSEVRIAAFTAAYVQRLSNAGRPNSAGRFLLSLSDEALHAAVSEGSGLKGAYGLGGRFLPLTEFLLGHAPERLVPLMDLILPPDAMTPQICTLVLTKDRARHEKSLVAKFRRMKPGWEQFLVAEVLCRADKPKYLRESLEIARTVLGTSGTNALYVCNWMLDTAGAEVLDDVVDHLERRTNNSWVVAGIVSSAVKHLGPRALPAVLAAFRQSDPSARLNLLDSLVKANDGTQDALICAELDSVLSNAKSQPAPLLGALRLAERGFAGALEEQIWPLLSHKSKPTRIAAARALAKLGDAAITRAKALLGDRKADVRSAAVALLAANGTSRALEALDARLDLESNDDVRDAMLVALDAARSAEGREVTREEVDARIARSASKLKAPVADWLDEPSLPALRFRDGQPVDPQTVRYLLYRQSRAKEIVPDVEAKPLYALIDRGTSGDFALEILKRFAASGAAPKDRWALTIAALLGDDRVVPVLNARVHEWADSARGKMAEYAVQALALLGSDPALMILDALAIRYRSKYKNIGQAAIDAFAAAAERLGITPDELGDRVVPWLGFEPGKPRTVDCDGRPFEVTIGPDFKLRYRDVQKNKAATSLPKSAPKEVLDEFKIVTATVREAAKAQHLRLENLMVRQFRWPVERWTELFLAHPLLAPFASRLVWGAYDDQGKLLATFRALDDRSLTSATDDEVQLPTAGTIGMIHPLELDDETRAAWVTHLADYEIAPPFPQMDRPVVHVADDQRPIKMGRDLEGTTLNALTFKGRADRLGWVRGSVTDAGSVDAYRKLFAAADVEAFLDLEGMFMGVGMNDNITLKSRYFVKSGSVQTGSYTYDNPSDENDARLIPFGAVPPVVFSEVTSELRRIAGKGEEASDG